MLLFLHIIPNECPVPCPQTIKFFWYSLAEHASRHLLTESWTGQLMNAGVIQCIGSLSRQMKAKVLGLRLVDATSSPKMLLRKSLLQQATPFSSDFEF